MCLKLFQSEINFIFKHVDESSLNWKGGSLVYHLMYQYYCTPDGGMMQDIQRQFENMVPDFINNLRNLISLQFQNDPPERETVIDWMYETILENHFENKKSRKNNNIGINLNKKDMYFSCY